MNKKYKRIIAKEFLILIGTILIVLLSALSINIVDNHYDDKASVLSDKIENLNDSISIVENKKYYFSKLVTKNTNEILKAIIESELTIDESNLTTEQLEGMMKELRMKSNLTPNQIWRAIALRQGRVSFEAPNIFEENIDLRFLYEIVKNDSLNENYNRHKKSYGDFESNISTLIKIFFLDINHDEIDEKLKVYYKFLVENNYINSEFINFLYSLNEAPINLRLESKFKSRELTDLLEQKENLITEQKELRSHIFYSRNIDKINLYIGVLIFILVYPIRLLFNSIKWSILTLKEK